MQKALVLVFTLGLTAVYAQTYQPGKIDFSVGFGFRTTDAQLATLDDYRALFPNSTLLQGDFQSYGYPDYYFNSTGMVSVLWGIQLKQNEGFEQRLRAGLTFSGTTPAYGSFYNETKFAYDTLTSSQTGEVTYVDSVFTESLYINTTQTQVGLDVAYLIKANQNGRWCFYGGVGIEIGAMLNAKATITRSDYSYYTNGAGNFYENNGWYGYNGDYDTEVQQLGGGFYTQLYLPVGLDLRLSMKNAFWRRMHLYSELRPSIGYTNSELTSNALQLSIGYSVFGVRADF